MEKISSTLIKGERYTTFAEFYKVNSARGLNKHHSSDRDVLSQRKATKSVKVTSEESKKNVMFGSDLFTEDFNKIKKEIDAKVDDVFSIKRASRSKKDVVGQSVLVERAMIGHPKSFSRRLPDRKKQKTVRFIYNITCSWSTSATERLKAGCIMMSIAEKLESVGYQVAIDLSLFASYENSSHPSAVCLVSVKDFKTRFNAKKMQFPFASGSVLFHLGCWWYHRFPGACEDYGSGEGRSVDYSPARQKEMKNYAKAHSAIYLSVPMIDDDFNFDVNKVLEYVLSKMKS